jgi:hypothetical protein
MTKNEQGITKETVNSFYDYVASTGFKPPKGAIIEKGYARINEETGEVFFVASKWVEQ